MRTGTKSEASNVVPGSLVVNSWTGSRGCRAVGTENSGDSRAPPVLPGASPALSMVTTQAHSCASHLSRVVVSAAGL